MGAGQSNDASPKIGPQIAAKVGNPAGLLCRRIWYSVGKFGVLGITEYRQGRPLIKCLMGNSVVTDVQFGHLFLVCIKYVALQEVAWLWVIQKDITL